MNHNKNDYKTNCSPFGPVMFSSSYYPVILVKHLDCTYTLTNLLVMILNIC